MKYNRKTLTTTMNGGTPAVLLMWCSSPIESEWMESERHEETHIKYKKMFDFWIICFTFPGKGSEKFCHMPFYNWSVLSFSWTHKWISEAVGLKALLSTMLCVISCCFSIFPIDASYPVSSLLLVLLKWLTFNEVNIIFFVWLPSCELTEKFIQ